MKEKIKKLIIDILTESEEITLTALKNHELFKKLCSGDLDWTISDEQGETMNILFMAGLNLDCIESFYELSSDKIIKIVPSDFWAVGHDGGEAYDLPIANSFIKYKTLHWSPRLIKRDINFKNSIT